ncbi:G-type lectin S-receptor-like serine/threonine-protein kinase LECRK3 [Ananas comosus]|uniref:Receptor-like serine/threonine-protein kinase n=2 Tax=Ananas comosus TaxID=4615 RepID=A0A6P5GG42_ANACO|nr:G-type lectin S-receptor-like serine/threonine-protein kinase LECRK3 [Ananas comosus]
MAFIVLSILLLLTLVSAQNKQINITLGSSITAADGAGWLSPSGRFAFGFYPKGLTGFAIGVWLATSPNRTIVWTASRDDPPLTDGSITLTFDGRLLWGASGGQEKAISQASEPVTTASMLDNGNFVLYGTNQQVIWSTFSSPTDTLLPGQSLVSGSELYSSVSETDRSTGNYRLNNQNDGNVVSYPAGTLDDANNAYWDTGTFQIGFPITLALNSNGVLYITGNNGNYSKNLAQATTSSGVDVYYRAIIDVDGILRLYSHTFGTNNASTTKVEWAALNDRCLVRGVCGLNSYCDLGPDGEPNCLCPPGFEFINSNQISLGCTSNSTSVGDCSMISSNGGEAGLVMATMNNITWADIPFFILPSTTSFDDCRAACLDDCFCEAALFRGDECSKQVLPLKYGRVGSNDTLFIKVGTMNTNNRSTTNDKKRQFSSRALITTAVLATFLAVVLTICGFLIYRNQRVRRYRRPLEYDNTSFDEETPLRSFSFEELDTATDGFREMLGKGAFGSVFKGALAKGEKVIAVKRLEKMVEDGEREFQREVRAIGRTHHRNLVRLLGFCNEGSNRLLVYEFMSNGSLANLLFRSENCPAWKERVKIALDVAKGLQYLHEELESHIIHCDIKPQNILMDSSGTAKIADFGLAKLLMPNQTRTFTGIRGTRGYLAPEWYKNAPITVKADVYSYGIVLLEIICCRRSMEMEETGEEHSLPEWMYECMTAGELRNVINDEVVDIAELERTVKVGLWCVQNEPVFRPLMRNVISMLEGNMETSIPPAPASFS